MAAHNYYEAERSPRESYIVSETHSDLVVTHRDTHGWIQVKKIDPSDGVVKWYSAYTRTYTSI